MSHVLLVQGNSLHIPLRAASVQCIVTSPPYFALRDYGTPGQLGQEALHDCLAWARHEALCTLCYLCSLRLVFAECWRVLREDGVLFVNIGDSYAATGKSGGGKQGEKWAQYGAQIVGPRGGKWRASLSGLKPKDLCGIPQRLSLALQSDGWYWRSEIIWHKPNPMPESVQDRPTRSHEQVLLFSKSPRYFWDAEAVREAATYGRMDYPHAIARTGRQATSSGMWRNMGDRTEGVERGMDYRNAVSHPEAGRNLRSVWTMPTQPYAGAHFATYPPALVELCIKAGTPEKGCCPQCRAPYVREMMEDTGACIQTHYAPGTQKAIYAVNGHHKNPTTNSCLDSGFQRVMRTTGFVPSCTCIATTLANGCRDSTYMDWLTTPVPAIVLDPFCGTATTLVVARALGRHAVGIDLSAGYLQLARDRLGLQALDAWLYGATVPAETHTDLPLFAGGEG